MGTSRHGKQRSELDREQTLVALFTLAGGVVALILALVGEGRVGPWSTVSLLISIASLVWFWQVTASVRRRRKHRERSEEDSR